MRSMIREREIYEKNPKNEVENKIMLITKKYDRLMLYS